VQEYLSKESTGQWHLVFDNADDIGMWIAKPASEQESSRLIDYLPRSKLGCIIFTTRNRKTAYELVQRKQNIIEVPEMTENVAIQLLQKHLPDHDLIKHEEDAKVLLEQLTYLPLAIVQAAAYINKNGIELAKYLSLLDDQEEEVVELLSDEFGNDGRYRNVKNPVATTWLISFEQIRHHDPLAAEYLSFMACITPKDIPQSLLPPGPSQKKATDAIGTLDAYSFIIRRLADQALDLHRLVHLATRNWLRTQQLIAQWTERAITRLEEVFPVHEHENRSVWRAYLPHARYALIFDTINQDSANRIRLVWKFGMCLLSDGCYNEAEGQFVKVFETRESVLGPEHPDTLLSMSSLALTYWNQGRWTEAEDLEVQVVETMKRVLGLEHPSTLTGMANLASIYQNQGRWNEAEDLFILVIKTRKRVLGPEHPNTLTTMASLASTYQNQGRWKEAEDLEVLVMETRN
jgi:tetratricopeptide (TPR) repeat protein